jgi:hypothetical protein
MGSKLAVLLAAAGLGAVGVAALTSGGPVSAQDIDIEFGGVATGAPGSTAAVAEEAVPGEFVGRACVGFLEEANNPSVHAGNDLIITSGDDVIEVLNMETIADSRVRLDERITLGETLRLEIRFGPDGVSSSSHVLTLDCPEVPPDTPPTTDVPVTNPPDEGSVPPEITLPPDTVTPPATPPATPPSTVSPPATVAPPTTGPSAPIPATPDFTG